MSDQRQRGERLRQRGRQLRRRAAFRKVGRSVLGRQISPALVGALGVGSHRHQLGVQPDDRAPVLALLEAENGLARGDPVLEDPEYRSDELVGGSIFWIRFSAI